MPLIMSWPANAATPLLTVTIKNFEFNDLDQFVRRQATGRTDGGVVFVEDLGVDDEFFEGQLMNLKPTEVSDLRLFFGEDQVNMQEKPFNLKVTSAPDSWKLIGLNTDQVIDGVALNTDQGFNTDEFVVPDTAELGIVFLDQSELVFQQLSRQRYSLSLRFRLNKGFIPEII